LLRKSLKLGTPLHLLKKMKLILAFCDALKSVILSPTKSDGLEIFPDSSSLLSMVSFVSGLPNIPPSNKL